MPRVTFLDLMNRASHVGTSVNEIKFKSKLIQPVVMTTERIIKPSFVVSMDKMAKGGRIVLNNTDYYSGEYEYAFLNNFNHVVDGKYSIPKGITGYGIGNRDIVTIRSTERLPGTDESSTFNNSFRIVTEGLISHKEIGSVEFLFNDRSSETHIVTSRSDNFLSFNVNKPNKFTVSYLETIEIHKQAYLFVSTKGESVRDYDNQYVSSSPRHIEMPNRLTYPDGSPNMFGLLSECTIRIKNTSNVIVYETKLPKIEPSSDFIYYFTNVDVRVIGTKCTLTNPPPWYKGPMEINYTRVGL